MPGEKLVAIGCYTQKMDHVEGSGRGILIAALDGDTGKLQSRHIVEGIRNPSYLCLSPAGDRLYAVEELDAADNPQIHAYALDPATGTLELLAKVPSPGSFACHIHVDHRARYLLVSNFVSGDLLCYRLSADGIPLPDPQIVTRPGNGTARMHCAIPLPGRDLLLICDAGNDAIAAYAIGGAGLDPKPVFESKAAAGSFPRHLALMSDGKTALVAHEHAATLGIVRSSDTGLEWGDVISSLPQDWTGRRSGAAVRIHPNGRIGYMSNRSHDSIFAAAIERDSLELTPVGVWKTGGRTPRDFELSPGGEWLIAANQDSNDLFVFSVDDDGMLRQTGHGLSTGSPVSVLFL